MRSASAAELPARAGRAARALGLGLGLCLSLAANGCSSEPPHPGPDSALQVDIDVLAEGTVIRNTDGSMWQGPARLVPEATIGSTDGPSELMFGRIADFEVTAEHIYVLEAQPPLVRKYDHDGNWIADLGGRGQGPGQFEWPAGLAVDATQEQVYVQHREPWRLARVSTNGGRPGTLEVELPAAEADMVLTPAGLARAVVLERAEGRFERSIALEWLPLDTLDPTRVPLEGAGLSAIWTATCDGGGAIAIPIPFAPEVQWLLFRHGGYALGRSDEYRFVIHSADGSTRTVHRYWTPVLASAAEREWRTRLARSGASCGGGASPWNGPDAPASKRAFDSLFSDGAGRIWVVREGNGQPLGDCATAGEPLSEWRQRPCWEAPVLVDIFDEEGRFLGPLNLPDGLRLHPRPAAKGDRILAVTLDAGGNPNLTWYRLQRPTASP